MVLGGGPELPCIGQASNEPTTAASIPRWRCAKTVMTIMVNCNPETVSTDYDTSGPSVLEPVTLEDVLETRIE